MATAAASAHACLRSKLVNASRAQLCRRVLTPWSRQPAAVSSAWRAADGIAARGLADHWPHAWAARRWLCVDASREFREVGVEHDGGAEDPYAWLEDQRTDAVRALVERENELALQALEETQGFQDALVKEMKARLSAQSEDQLPHTVRGYEYFERTPVDKEHSILCRRVAGSSGDDAEVQELLDVNQLAAGTGFAEVALDLYSHDGTAMAYMVDTTGTEAHDLYVKDLRSGATHHVAPHADGVVFVDADTPSGILYLTRDSANKQVTLWHCALLDGMKPGRKNKLWSLRDAACEVSLLPVGDGKWAKLACKWLQRSQLYIVNATSAAAAANQETGTAPAAQGGVASRGAWQNLSRHRPLLTHPHDPVAWLDVEEHNGALYVVSTRAPYNVWQMDPTDASPENWRLMFRETPGVQILRANTTEQFCVLGLKKDSVFLMEVYPWKWLLDRLEAGKTTAAGCAPELSVRPWEAEGTAHRSDVDTPYSVRMHDPVMDVTTLEPRTQSPELDAVRLHVLHPTARPAVFQLDLATATATRLSREPKWTKFPWSLFEMKYEAYKMTAKAPDGELVPMTVVHKAGLKLNRGNPCLMMTYGAYGLHMDTSFDVPMLSLIRRGWVIAYAHVRGGGEKGEKWHEQGRALNKMNTFSDFEACARHMASCGLTRQELMAAYAGSAGATVLGYTANELPHLFKALVLESPFLDVENTLMSDDYEYAVEDRLEWGDPHDAGAREVIRAFDPVPNVKKQDYPWLLCIASWQDTRVPYWHAAKYIARIIDDRTNNAPLLLRVRDGSHLGGSHRSFTVEQSAYFFAFLTLALGQPLK